MLADDHPDILDELRRLLTPEFEVIAAVKDGEALVRAAAELSPDAVISDIYMTGGDGIESGALILRQGLCSAVIVLTMYDNPHLVRRTLAQGIRGYVLKEDASEELIAAVHTVIGGGEYLSCGVRDQREGET